MAEQLLVIQKEDLRVLSEIRVEHRPGGRTLVWVMSSVNGETLVNRMTLPQSMDYSAEQMEYDIEVARHRFAEMAAGAMSVRSLVAAILKPTVGDPVVVSGGPRLKRPRKS